MALEDAVVLADAIAAAPDLAAGLAAYEQRRRSRVERIVRAGARSSSSKIPGPIGRVFQEAVLRLVFRAFVTDKSVRVDDRLPGQPGGCGQHVLVGRPRRSR